MVRAAPSARATHASPRSPPPQRAGRGAVPLAQPPLHATSPRQLRYLLPLAQFDVGRAQAYRRGGARAKRSTGSDLTEEQKQEIREAFGLLGSGVGGGGVLAASVQRPSERLFAGCPLDLAAEPSPRDGGLSA